jgi:copper homeostasis protein (lipoprotein)
MKKLILVLAIAFLSCNSKNSEKLAQSDLEKEDADIETNVEKATIYEGLLPCADCEGIETTLKIYQGDGTTESHVFELTTVYKGKKAEKPFIEDGNFNTERGLEDDQDGTVYVLNWDKPQSEQILYGCNSDNPEKMYLLNNKREKIKSQLDYFLQLKK